MAAKEGFSRTLKEQRMNFRQFVDLNDSNFRVVRKGNANKIYIVPDAAARIKERPDGTLVQYQRLRLITN